MTHQGSCVGFRFRFNFDLTSKCQALIEGGCDIDWEICRDGKGKAYTNFNVDIEEIGYRIYLDDADKRKLSEYFDITKCWNEEMVGESKKEIESKIIDEFVKSRVGNDK